MTPLVQSLGGLTLNKYQKYSTIEELPTSGKVKVVGTYRFDTFPTAVIVYYTTGNSKIKHNMHIDEFLGAYPCFKDTLGRMLDEN